MNKKIIKIVKSLAALLLVFSLLVSCKKNSEPIYTVWCTLVKESNAKITFMKDDKTYLDPINSSDLGNPENAKSGQRMLLNFSEHEKPADATKPTKIKILGLSDIALYSTILENGDFTGESKVTVNDINQSGGYVNVNFTFTSSTANPVSGDSEGLTDKDRIHLFRLVKADNYTADAPVFDLLHSGKEGEYVIDGIMSFAIYDWYTSNDWVSSGQEKGVQFTVQANKPVNEQSGATKSFKLSAKSMDFKPFYSYTE